MQHDIYETYDEVDREEEFEEGEEAEEEEVAFDIEEQKAFCKGLVDKYNSLHPYEHSHKMMLFGVKASDLCYVGEREFYLVEAALVGSEEDPTAEYTYISVDGEYKHVRYEQSLLGGSVLYGSAGLRGIVQYKQYPGMNHLTWSIEGKLAIKEALKERRKKVNDILLGICFAIALIAGTIFLIAF